tara:strand:- start:4910 stop:5998 length:1089 start_codon:yes stop_codon:yes gene_type:complete
MNPILSLLLVFTVCTFLHLGITTKNSFKLIIPYFLPGQDVNSYLNNHPANNRLRFLLSTVLLLTPIILFLAYKKLHIENISVNITIILILIFLTAYLTHFNYFKIWSDKFRTVPKPKIDQELFLEESKKNNIYINEKLKSVAPKLFITKTDVLKEIQRSNEKFITKGEFNISLEDIKQNLMTPDQLNEFKTDVSKVIQRSNEKFITKAEFNISLKDIKQNLVTSDQLNEFKTVIINEILDKAQKKDLAKLEQSLPFKSYFIKEDVYNQFEILLQENGFYNNKRNLEALPLCTLICKLVDLKVIRINKRKTFVNNAIAIHFKTNSFTAGYFSQVYNDYIDDDLGKSHKKVFKNLKYLDKLNKL